MNNHEDPKEELQRLAALIDEAENPPERGLGLRVFWGLVWFIPLAVVIDLVLILVVGQIAVMRADDPAAGYEVGGAAAGAFFSEYGPLVLAAQTLLWAGLCVGGWLPGTSRYRKPRGAGRKRR